jgi:hypothetical protein
MILVFVSGFSRFFAISRQKRNGLTNPYPVSPRFRTSQNYKQLKKVTTNEGSQLKSQITTLKDAIEKLLI